jgi:hypothetical protein
MTYDIITKFAENKDNERSQKVKKIYKLYMIKCLKDLNRTFSIWRKGTFSITPTTVGSNTIEKIMNKSMSKQSIKKTPSKFLTTSFSHVKGLTE